jgi:Cdc6-like AAA superfamily ATPase
MPTLDDYLKDGLGRSFTRNIKEKRVFDPDYIPPKIYERKELFQIADAMMDYLRERYTKNLIISGPRGYGKTVSVRYTLSRTEKAIREEGDKDTLFFYVSCHQAPTTYSVLKSIINAKEGIQRSLLWKKAEDFLSNKKGIIVLDEADFLKDTDILYLLTRNTQLILICVVRSPYWYVNLDDSIQSTLQPKFIVFGKYKPEELVEILKQRAELGLYHYDEKGIALLASLVIQKYNGDVRFAIKALEYMGMADKWDEQTILNSLAEGIEEFETFLVEKLSDEGLMILKILTEFPDGLRTSELYLKVKKHYQMAKSTFFSIIGDLEKDGLITTLGGKKGKSYFVAPTINNPHVVKREFEKREKEVV